MEPQQLRTFQDAAQTFMQKQDEQFMALKEENSQLRGQLRQQQDQLQQFLAKQQEAWEWQQGQQERRVKEMEESFREALVSFDHLCCEVH